MLQAWKEAYHKIFGVWEVQTMWNLQKNVMCMENYVLVKKRFITELNMALLLWASLHRVETHWLSGKEKVPGAAVRKEGHADSLLEHERNHHYWFHWKRGNCKQWFFQLPTPLAKFILSIKWPSYNELVGSVEIQQNEKIQGELFKQERKFCSFVTYEFYHWLVSI